MKVLHSRYFFGQSFETFYDLNFRPKSHPLYNYLVITKIDLYFMIVKCSYDWSLGFSMFCSMKSFVVSYFLMEAVFKNYTL